MKDKTQILANKDIQNRTVRVVTDAGNNVMPTFKAIALAESQQLDLVIINDRADPPICHITDLGKYRYDLKMKAKANSKAQRESRITIKEVQFKPNIDGHDFDTKCRNITKFIDKGNIVKVQVQFKGRERQHTNLGFELIDRVLENVENVTLDGKPQFSGNRITAILKGIKDGTKLPK